MKRFLIGSGFHKDPEFANLWVENLQRHVKDLRRVVVISIAGASLPFIRMGLSEINLDGNCGHIGALLDGSKDRTICGWTAAVCALAMCAYCDEADFVYLEEDCLAFGPWIDRVYADMGEGNMVFGRKHESEPSMECSQSLFLVRHSFIPSFVADMIQFGDERHKDSDGKEDRLPERKFVMIEEKYGTGNIKRLSIPGDRERPIRFGEPVFYAQRWTNDELDEARKRGLL